MKVRGHAGVSIGTGHFKLVDVNAITKLCHMKGAFNKS